MKRVAIWISVLFSFLSTEPAVAELVSFTMSGAVQNVVGNPLGLTNGHPVAMTGVFDDQLFLDAFNPDVCAGDNLGCPVNWNLGNSGQPWSLTLGNAVSLDASMDAGSGFPGIVYTAEIPENVELDFRQGVNNAPFTSGFGCNGGFIGNICTVNGNDVDTVNTFEFTLDLTTYQASPLNPSGQCLLANPPTLLTTTAVPNATAIDVIGTIAYIGTQSGLSLYSVPLPTSLPTLLGSVALPDSVDGVAVQGSIAFVAAETRLYAIDVADPTAPSILSTTMMIGLDPEFPGDPDPLFDLAIDGDRLYLAADFDVFRMFDVSNPLLPVWATAFGRDDSASASDVAAAGNVVYLAVSNITGGELWAVDVSNPESPTLLDVESLGTDPIAMALTLSGGFAYIADDDVGFVHVVDISDPSNLSLKASVATSGVPEDIAVSGSIAYYASSAGLGIVDVSSPTTPVNLPPASSAGAGTRLDVVNGTAYVVDPLADEFYKLAVPSCPLAGPELVLHYRFDAPGNAPGSQGSERRPLKMLDDAGAVLDFHTADGEGVSGLPGDRAFANTGASDHGQSASADTDGFRAAQTSDDDDADALESFTISGWFKTETAASFQTKTPRLVNNHDGAAGAAGDGFNLQFLSGTDGDLKLEIDDDTGGGVNTIGTPYAAKQKWVFFAVSYDGTSTVGNVHFYRGFRSDAEAGGGLGSATAQLVGTASLDRGSVDDESVALHVGNRPGSNRPFDGFLDDIRIYRAPLGGEAGRRAVEGIRQEALRGPRGRRISYAGTTTVATSATDQNANLVTVDELSGVSYDPDADRFWAVSDGRGRLLEIDANFNTDGSFASASAVSAVTLADNLDFEGIVFLEGLDRVLICDESDSDVGAYDVSTGNFLFDLPVNFIINDEVRPNRSFEALGRRADGGETLAGVEQSLFIDGPDGSSPSAAGVSRWVQFNAANVETQHYAYPIEPLHGDAVGSSQSGLGEMLALPDGSVLTLERSEADGEFLTRIFEVQTAGATDVSAVQLVGLLDGENYTPMQKRLIYSDDSLGKVEGLALGPQLSVNGGQAILVVEDASGINRIHSFRLDTLPEPATTLQLIAGAGFLALLARRRVGGSAP